MLEVIHPAGVTDAQKYGWSHAVKVRGGSLVFVAGQVAFDASGNVVGRGDMRAQLEQAFANLKKVVEAAGSSLENVILLRIYVTSADAYRAASREVYYRYFPQHRPCVTLIEVPRLFSRDLMVEIEAVASVDDARKEPVTVRAD